MERDLGREADLHYAYQHGVDVVRGDIKAEAEFKQTFAGDVEAEVEYQRGLVDESRKQMESTKTFH